MSRERIGRTRAMLGELKPRVADTVLGIGLVAGSDYIEHATTTKEVFVRGALAVGASVGARFLYEGGYAREARGRSRKAEAIKEAAMAASAIALASVPPEQFIRTSAVVAGINMIAGRSKTVQKWLEGSTK